MANTLTLDDIRAAAEAKFGATEIPLGDGAVCRLLSPVRMSKAKRAALVELTKSKGDEDDETAVDDTEETLVGVIKLAAETEEQANRLLAFLTIEGEIDLGMASVVVESFLKAQQVGEA